MPNLETPVIRIPRHSASNDASLHPSLLERTETQPPEPSRKSHKKSSTPSTPVVRRIDIIVALIRERGVCSGVEFEEPGKAKGSTYTPFLEELGFRSINVTFSASAKYRRFDLFENGFRCAKYYFEEPFNERVARYFANLLRAPIDAQKTRIIKRALERGGFSTDEARTIIALRYTYSGEFLRQLSRREIASQPPHEIEHDSGRP